MNFRGFRIYSPHAEEELHLGLLRLKEFHTKGSITVMFNNGSARRVPIFHTRPPPRASFSSQPNFPNTKLSPCKFAVFGVGGGGLRPRATRAFDGVPCRPVRQSGPPPSLPALSQGGNSSEAGGRIRWTSWRHDVVGF